MRWRDGSAKRPLGKGRSPSSSDLLMRLIEEAEKLCLHGAYVTALTL
jgi:hypothetical protein